MLQVSLRTATFWVIAQIVLTVAFRLIYKLVENAVIGWGDERIGEYFGITAVKVITFLLEWGLPFVMAGAVLLLLHLFYTKRSASLPQHEGDKFYSPTVTQSAPKLAAGLYIGEIRFTLGELKAERHTDITMRVFNGTGRIVEFASVSGRIKFNAPNSLDGPAKDRRGGLVGWRDAIRR